MVFSPLSGMGSVPSEIEPKLQLGAGSITAPFLFLFLGIDQPIWVQNSREKPFRMQVHGIKLVMYQNGLSGKPP